MTDTRKKTFRNLGTIFIAICSGLVFAQGFSPSTSPLLSVIGLATLFFLWRTASAKWCFLQGLTFYSAMLSYSLPWLFKFFYLKGMTSNQLASFAIGFFFILLFSLICAFMGYSWSKLKIKHKAAVNFLILLPTCYTLFTWAQSWIVVSFPWYFIGNAMIDTPMRGWGPIIGVYGMNWLTVMTLGCLLLLWEKRKKITPALTIVLPLIVFVWATGWMLQQISWTKPSGPAIHVKLLKGNFSPEIRKHNPHDMTMKYFNASKTKAKAKDVIIWPEGAFVNWSVLLYSLQNDIASWAHSNKVTLLAGWYKVAKTKPNLFGKKVIYRQNMIKTFGQKPTVNYIKIQPIKLIEYIPEQQWLWRLFSPKGDKVLQTIPGTENQPPLIVNDSHVSPLICVESTEPSSSFRNKGLKNWILTVSDASWYRNSITSIHVLLFSRMRSLETGMEMAYDSNLGKTAIINDHGQIRAQTHGNDFATIRGTIQPRKGNTPYMIIGWQTPIGLMLLVIAYFIVRFFINKKT